MLTDCRFPSRGQRPGFVPFRALCVADRIAADKNVAQRFAMRELERLARALGGMVLEDEVVWLPADEFEDVWTSE